MGSRKDRMGSRNDFMDSSRDNSLSSRDMIYQRNIGGHGNMGGGSTSPPGPSVDGMQIGTWNEGKENNSSNSNFPLVSHFDIGTSNVNCPGSRTFASNSSFNHMNGAPQSNYGPIQHQHG